jgi:hypothetical protein
MSISTSNSTKEARAFSIGPWKMQILDFVANSGATSGTVTADGLKELNHIFTGGGGALKQSAAATFSGNVATLAFSVPAETKASLVQDNLTYTAVANLGASGNSLTIAIVDGTGDDTPVTEGNEVVEVSGTDITVRIDPTVLIGSTKQDVVDALTASAEASALITSSVATGHETDVASVEVQTNLASGVTGGARGSLICIGR